MSDNDSDDVVMVENTEETSRTSEPIDTLSAEVEPRPIMKLFKRLITNDNKQNTILTNAQIIAILHTEFQIDVTVLHELEVDIYLNVVKRFLKDWPQWDEFDQGINFLRKQNAIKSIRKTLETKYIDLIAYLQEQLDKAKPLAEEAVKKVIKDNAKRMEQVDTSHIVLEVHCTRKQLNELILSQPAAGDEDHNIFNVTDFKPSSIVVNKLPIESILNWFGVRVTIDIKALAYQRTVNHQLKHVMVNSKNGPRNFTSVLNTQLQIRESKRSQDGMDTNKFLQFFVDLLKSESIENNNRKTILLALIEIMKSDLHGVDVVTVPGTYRQYSTKYPYYRKLKSDGKPSVPSSTYDLYIEETLAPMHVFSIGLAIPQKVKNDTDFLLLIECTECKIQFFGDEMYTLLREHFDTYHSDEPVWNCTNCGQTHDFIMTELARNKWQHECS